MPLGRIVNVSENKKSVTEYGLDFTNCSLCGACIEACPSYAIHFSRAYNLASTDKGDFHYDLMKRPESGGKEP